MDAPQLESADLFSACLTTPIPVALRWLLAQNKLSLAGLEASGTGSRDDVSHKECLP